MEITQVLLKELFDYDAKRGVLINKTNRGSAIKGRIAGSINTYRDNPRRSLVINKKRYYTYRLIWLYHYGTWPLRQIDHINGNSLDDKIENLREATQTQNNQNLHKAKCHNQAGYLGVQHRKDINKYTARIAINGKASYLGAFHTPEEAHAAYCAAKRKLHTFNPEVRAT